MAIFQSPCERKKKKEKILAHETTNAIYPKRDAMVEKDEREDEKEVAVVEEFTNTSTK